MRPGLGESHLLGHPHTDVGGPGVLADPGPFPRPSMADVKPQGEAGARPARAEHRHGSQWQVRCTGSVVVLTRQRSLPFLHVLPTLVEDLLDIVGRSYDGIDFRATPKDQAPDRQTACARRRQLL